MVVLTSVLLQSLFFLVSLMINFLAYMFCDDPNKEDLDHALYIVAMCRSIIATPCRLRQRDICESFDR